MMESMMEREVGVNAKSIFFLIFYLYFFKRILFCYPELYARD